MAPPLVSHGFGGDGDDIVPRVPPHRTVARIYVAVAIAVAVMTDGDIFDVRFSRRQRGWQTNDGGRSERVLRGSPGFVLVLWAGPR